MEEEDFQDQGPLFQQHSGKRQIEHSKHSLYSVSNNTKGHTTANAVASKQERPSKQERESVKLCRQLSAYSKHHIEHQHQACNHFQPMAHRYRSSKKNRDACVACTRSLFMQVWVFLRV